MNKLYEDKYLLVSLTQPLLHLKKATSAEKQVWRTFLSIMQSKAFKKKKKELIWLIKNL